MKLKTKIQIFILILIFIVSIVQFLIFVNKEKERAINVRKKICFTLIQKLKDDIIYAVIIDNKKFLKNILTNYLNIDFLDNIEISINGQKYFSLKNNQEENKAYRFAVDENLSVKNNIKKIKNLRIRAYFNINDINKNFKIHLYILILFLILTYFISFIIVEYVTSKFLSPIDEFLETINKTSKGNYEFVDVTGASEFSSVFKAYNNLISTLKKKEFEIKKKVKELEDTNEKLKEKIIEIEMLHSKIIRQEKLASLGTMTAGIAHEINNPVGAIKIISEMALMVKDKSKYEEYFSKIIKHCDRLQGIIKSIKDFSKDIVKDNFEKIKLGELIQESIELSKHSMLLPDSIKITGNFQEDKTELKCNKISLMEVFQNLISNSVDAMNPSGEIKINIKQDNNLILINYSDTGSGIKKEIRDKIFDPFFTTKGTNGTGLGLFIVYKILKNHGGDINILSNDKGAAFQIVLPKNIS